MAKRNALFFSKKAVLCLFVVLISFGFSLHISAQSYLDEYTDSLDYQRNTDSLKVKEKILSSKGPRLIINRGDYRFKDTLSVQRLKDTRLLSVQQLLKGNVAGVYVQENNGEPGSIQSMLIRGLSSPIFSNKDVSGVQPVVYVNGIPLAQDLPYIYDFKMYDINPVGAASNILAGLDIQSIESVEVIKNPLELARLGPLAANGAIWIITKDGFYGGKNISINASAGMTFAPSKIKMTNGAYEKAFRQNFYDTYNIPTQKQYYPGYLSDTRESNYFGTPDWADSYYESSPIYNVNASIGSRSTAANYIFTLGITQDAGIANKVDLTKYNIGFSLNMTPLKGLTASTYINANRIIRKRNKNIRDRLAEVEYFPDLSMPLAPANGTYDRYLGYHELTKDENLNNLLNGYLSLRYTLDRFYANVGLMLDYNTNVRHVFWPSSLMESVSSVSDYSGYNRRLIGRVNSGYLFDFGNHGLDIHWDGSIQSDYSHYNYIHGLDGEDDTKTISKYFLRVYRLADRLETRLVSTSFSLDYNYNKLFYASALVRYDGSSNIQLDDRWLFTPSFSLGWDLRKLFFNNSSFLSKFFLKSSWARLGHLVQSDRFTLGPNYVSSEMQWNGQPLISSSNGFASVTRPYSIGWIDYDMGWPYSDKLSVDINASFLNNRISAGISLYENREKDMIVQVPVVKEFGYNSKFMNGMEISNKGIDLNISASILPYINKDRLSWDMAFNMNYNRNELKKLPDGLNEVVVDGRKLQVGQSIDAFWLYQNNGIYNDYSDVPVKDGKRLSLGGIAFQKGDPIWVDQNGDNVISDKDRILKGHSLPQFTGGWTNQFRYKQFDIAFHLFFALGHSALNIRDHQRYDFINIERTGSFNSIKEITFWRKDDNQKDGYPIYNPLSKVHPYRAEQDMFLEKLSYLKLRNVTLGYTLPLKKQQSLESLYFYLTANNILTVSNFSGNDPELVGFSGYYDGYSIPIPRSLSLGLRFNF